MNTFIYKLWADIFNILRWISIFQYIRFLPFAKSHGFVELWVLSNTFLAFIAYLSNKIYEPGWWSVLFICYGFLRVFEIIVYQINVVFFDEFRAEQKGLKYAVKSYRRILILLLHNYVEIIFWFASSYLVLYPHFQVAYNDTVFNAIYASFRVTTNLGLDSVEALTNLGRNLLWVQSISGLLMTIISIARFINVLPIPDTDDPTEKSKK